ARLADIDRHVRDRHPQLRPDRHGEPLRPRGGLDRIAILPAVLLELHGVEEDEEIGFSPLGQVAEPRQVVRLMDGDLHGVLTKTGLVRSWCGGFPRASTRKTSGAPSNLSSTTAGNGVSPAHLSPPPPFPPSGPRTRRAQPPPPPPG